MAEKLNLYDGIFCFLVFFVPPVPHRQKFKILSSSKSNYDGFRGFVKIWLKSVAQILRNLAEKKGATRYSIEPGSMEEGSRW